MNKTRTGVVAIGSLLLQACGQMPQTAEEFRKLAPGAMLMKTDTYQVNRALSDVASTFETKAPGCLNVSVHTSSQTSTSASNFLTHYKATVVLTDERAELHVQQLHEGSGIIYPSKPPEGGVYILVADAYLQSNNSTRIELYGPSIGYDALYRAVRGWSSGENLGCPDMTKVP